MIRVISILLLVLVAGCAHQPRTDHHYGPCVFIDENVAEWRKSAIAAASSSDFREQNKFGSSYPWELNQRITQGPLRLVTDSLQYRLDGPIRDSVIVTIPCWAKGERFETYLKITMDRNTGLIHSMKEERE